MFCNACGTENIDSAAFCNACGAKLVSKNTIGQNARTAQSAFEKEQASQKLRTELAELILRVYRSIQPQTENYQEAMSIEQQIDQEKVALSENEKRDSSKKLGYAVMLFVAYVLLAIFFMTQMIPPIPEGASDPIIKTTINIAIALFTPSLFLIASAAFFFSYKGEERDKTKTAKHLSSSIKENKEKAQVITTKIVKNYNSIPNNFIDFKYADPWSLWTLYQIVSTGRADTLKEAILYFDELCHRQKMEDIALQQLNITQQIFDQTVEIRKSLHFIELMSTVNASTSSVVAASVFSR